MIIVPTEHHYEETILPGKIVECKLLNYCRDIVMLATQWIVNFSSIPNTIIRILTLVLFFSPLFFNLRYAPLVQFLINKGSNLNHKSVNGADTLHVACRAGNVKMAYLILSAGAYVDTTDSAGDTPFLWCLKVRTYTLSTQLLHVHVCYCVLA